MKHLFPILSVIFCVGGAYAGRPIDLIVPRGIVYSAGSFVLTREMSAHEISVSSSAQGRSQDTKKTDELTTAFSEGSSDSLTTKTVKEDNFGSRLGALAGNLLGGEKGESIGSALGELAYYCFCPTSILTPQGSREHVKVVSSSRENSVLHSTAHLSSAWSQHSTAGTQVEQRGDWHLKFVVTLHGEKPEGRYRIGSNPRVWIFGLSKPVSVDCPACAGREFSADGIICPFDLKIDDSVLLRELQLVAARARVAAWAWETLSIEIRASDFAVFSLTDSDENVMERRAVNVRLIPMTEIAVEFGDVAKLSPWCVRQRWPDSREPVVLREALRAVNASAASYDAMPYETFCFATNGVLRSVSRRSVAGNGMADSEDGIFLGIRLVGKDGTRSVRPLLRTLLERPVSDFQRISVVELSLMRTAQAVFSNACAFASMRDDMVAFLDEEGHEGSRQVWKEEWKRLAQDRLLWEQKQRIPETPPGTLTNVSVRGCAFSFVYCPSNATTRGFWIGRTEVTQRQWKSLMGSNPSEFRADGASRPVERVSWHDCQKFCRQLEEVSGLQFRLPTSKEWMLACRAGADVLSDLQLDEVAWYGANAGNETHDVAGKRANAWGIHDMLGNVLEWTADTSKEGEPNKVICGGFFASERADCASDRCDFLSADQCAEAVGFRIVFTP